MRFSDPLHIFIILLFVDGRTEFEAECTPGEGGTSCSDLAEEETAFLQTGVRQSFNQVSDSEEDGKKEPSLITMQTLIDQASMAASSLKSRPHADQQQEKPKTTTKKFKINANSVSKVKLNGAGDLGAFIHSAILDTLIFCFFAFCFMVLQFYYKDVYSRRVSTPDACPGNVCDGPITDVDWQGEGKITWFGWMRASLFLISDEQLLETCGLDAYQLIKFSMFAIELMALMGIPLAIVMAPVYAVGGGGWAGPDHLSWIGVGNVVYHPPVSVSSIPLTHEQEEVVGGVQYIWWLLAFITWAVVATVQWRIFHHQRIFLKLRTDWLLKLPAPRATTVLVEGIPDHYCRDEEFKALFEQLFPGKVAHAFVIKKVAHLDKLITTYQDYSNKIGEIDHVAQQGEPEPTFCCGGGNQREFYEKALGGDPNAKEGSLEKKGYKQAIIDEQESINTEAKKPLPATISETFQSVYSCNGFVTFTDRDTAELCKHAVLNHDEDTLVCSAPPDPSDVLYYGLSIPINEERFLNFFGYAALVGLFFIFLPIVLAIAQLTDINVIMKVPIFKTLIDATGLKATLQGFLASLGVTIMMSFLPTFLKLIFQCFFSAHASRWDQLRIQRWYFWFLVVFVLLITAVGGGLPETLERIAKSPMSILSILAEKLPLSTHFFLGYCVMQPFTHGMNLTRYMNFIKWVIFKRTCPADVVPQRAEPEDQDYYGCGSRSARFTLMLTIGIVFGTICPLMHFVVMWNFFVCRLVYGYLIPCAEMKKIDLGGLHWDLQLTHTSLAVVIYILLMTGILLQRSESRIPGILAGLSFVFWAFSFVKFRGKLRCENLGFVELSDHAKEGKKLPQQEGTKYEQTELYAKPEDLLKVQWPQ